MLLISNLCSALHNHHLSGPCDRMTRSGLPSDSRPLLTDHPRGRWSVGATSLWRIYAWLKPRAIAPVDSSNSPPNPFNTAIAGNAGHCVLGACGLIDAFSLPAIRHPSLISPYERQGYPNRRRHSKVYQCEGAERHFILNSIGCRLSLFAKRKC
jgi:hypothetical protein